MHWRRKWQPTPVPLPGESQGRRSLHGLPSIGSHRVGHDWSNLAAAVCFRKVNWKTNIKKTQKNWLDFQVSQLNLSHIRPILDLTEEIFVSNFYNGELSNVLHLPKRIHVMWLLERIEMLKKKMFWCFTIHWRFCNSSQLYVLTDTFK